MIPFASPETDPPTSDLHQSMLLLFQSSTALLYPVAIDFVDISPLPKGSAPSFSSIAIQPEIVGLTIRTQPDTVIVTTTISSEAAVAVFCSQYSNCVIYKLYTINVIFPAELEIIKVAFYFGEGELDTIVHASPQKISALLFVLLIAVRPTEREVPINL